MALARAGCARDEGGTETPRSVFGDSPRSGGDQRDGGLAPREDWGGAAWLAPRGDFGNGLGYRVGPINVPPAVHCQARGTMSQVTLGVLVVAGTLGAILGMIIARAWRRRGNR